MSVPRFSLTGVEQPRSKGSRNEHFRLARIDAPAFVCVVRGHAARCFMSACSANIVLSFAQQKQGRVQLAFHCASSRSSPIQGTGVAQGCSCGPESACSLRGECGTRRRQQDTRRARSAFSSEDAGNHVSRNHVHYRHLGHEQGKAGRGSTHVAARWRYGVSCVVCDVRADDRTTGRRLKLLSICCSYLRPQG